MTTVESPVRPLQLTMPSSFESNADSVLPVRWCVNPDVLASLKERHIATAHVLISVLHDASNEETGRYVVPLLSEMAFVRFTRPGQNTVRATIVWPERHADPSAVRSMRNQLTSRSIKRKHGEVGYDFRIIDYSDRTFGDGATFHFLYAARAEGEDRIDVIVPSEVFAPEPNRHIKRYIRTVMPFWHSVDQCAWRKQKIAALLTLPFFFVFAVLRAFLLQVVVLAQMLAGIRGIHYALPYQPLRNIADIVDVGSSVWLTRKDGTSTTWLSIVNPVTVLCVAMIAFGMAAIIQIWASWSTAFVIAACIIGVAVIGLLMYLTFGEKTMPHIRNVFYAIDNFFTHRRDVRVQKEHEEVLEDLDSLMCNGFRSPELSAVPRRHRTLSLRYQATKAKVCKPYAR